MTIAEDFERYLDARDVAKILKCSTQHARALMKKMSGFVAVSDRGYRVPESCFAAWLEDRAMRGVPGRVGLDSEVCNRRI